MSNPFFYRLNGLSLNQIGIGGKVRAGVLHDFGLGHLAEDIVSQDDAVIAEQEIDGAKFLVMVPKIAPSNSTPKHVDFDLERDPKKNRLQWLAHPGGKSAIGWVKDDLPDPDVLFRKRPLPGLPTLDACGREWLVPVGRSNAGNETFERDFVFDLDAGGVKRIRSKSGDRLFEVATEIFDLYQVDDDDPNLELMDMDRLFLLVVEALGFNYRVGPMEINAFAAMGAPVINNSTIDAFGQSVTDWDVWKEYQKKTKSEKQDSGVLNLND